MHNAQPILLGLLLVVMTTSCFRGATAPDQPHFALEQSVFQAEQAYQEVADFVQLGPRVSGSPGARKAAEYLQQRLTELTIDADIQAFSERGPLGTTTFYNVIGTLPGDRPEILLLGSHFDTKYGIDGFVGANDSGSSSGLLLELGRVWQESIADTGNRPTLRLLFFDGEECRHRYGPHDGFHGSKWYVQHLLQQKEAGDVTALILLDMVGDRDLSITIPRNSTPDLALLAFQSASAVGCREAFSWYQTAIGDDHVAFLDAGIPAVDLIDFQFGSKPGQNDYWHTNADTMDKVSIESLDKVGRVTLRMLQSLVEDMQTDKSAP